jgi:hypothetical protein
VAVHELDLTEPTKEQEEIIGAHAIVFQMTLRGAGLAERRRPAGLSAARCTLQIGVEVSECISSHASPSEVRDDVGDVESTRLHPAVSNPSF